MFYITNIEYIEDIINDIAIHIRYKFTCACDNLIDNIFVLRKIKGNNNIGYMDYVVDIWEIDLFSYGTSSLLNSAQDKLTFINRFFSHEKISVIHPVFALMCDNYYDEYIKKKMSEYIFLVDNCGLLVDITQSINKILYRVIR